MKYFIIVLSVAAVLAAVILTVFIFVSRTVFGRGRPYDIEKAFARNPTVAKRIKYGYDSLEKYASEECSVLSYDGINLIGKLYYCNPNPVGYVICVHGYHSGAREDFGSAADFFAENGFNLLLVDQRAHGKSGGKRTTFGVKERFDCRSWCDFIVKKFGRDVKIILDGISMGSATVVMASDRKVGLPSNVRAIIADCGYTSPWEIVCDVSRKAYHITKFPFMYIFRLAVRIDAGFDLKSVSAESACSNTDIPIFFAHGTGDKFVPYEMSVKNRNACSSDSFLFSVENAGHGMSFILDYENYTRECMNFIKKYI